MNVHQSSIYALPIVPSDYFYDCNTDRKVLIHPLPLSQCAILSGPLSLLLNRDVLMNGPLSEYWLCVHFHAVCVGNAMSFISGKLIYIYYI